MAWNQDGMAQWLTQFYLPLQRRMRAMNRPALPQTQPPLGSSPGDVTYAANVPRIRSGVAAPGVSQRPGIPMNAPGVPGMETNRPAPPFAGVQPVWPGQPGPNPNTLGSGFTGNLSSGPGGYTTQAGSTARTVGTNVFGQPLYDATSLPGGVARWGQGAIPASRVMRGY